jgi:flagellar basal body-associated protein FliL
VPITEAATQPSDPPATSKGRARGIITVLLVILTSLSILLAGIGVWIHNTLLVTDTFMERIEPALETPEFRTAFGDQVSTRVLTALDLETRISNALSELDAFLLGVLSQTFELGDRAQQLLQSFDRPTLETLAPTISSELEDRITARIDTFVQSPDFGSRMSKLIRGAHEATIALARDDFTQLPNVSVENGKVQVNLIPVIGEAIRNVLPDLSGIGPDISLPDKFSDQAAAAKDQLSTALGSRLPDDFGMVTLMDEGQLTALQDGVIMMDRAMWLLIAVALVLLVVTLVVSQTRRRTTVQLAIGIVIAALLGELLIRSIEGQVADAVIDPNGREAVVAIMAEIFRVLRQGFVLLAVAAVILGFSFYLAGRPEWAMRVKGWWEGLLDPGAGPGGAGRWVADHDNLLRWIGIGLALVALTLTWIDLFGVVIIGVLLGLYLNLVSKIKSRAVAPETEPVSV